MTDLTPTIVRIPKDKFERYKDLAQELDMSFSEFVRHVLEASADSIVVTGGKIGRPRKRKRLPIFDIEKYGKYATGRKNRDAVEHDKILYGES